MADLVTVSVQIPYDRAKKLKAWAADSGLTFHKYMQKILQELSSGNPRVFVHEHHVSSDSNVADLTETMIFQVPLDLGLRLHSAARQMRDPADRPVSPSWLARHIILHYTHKRSDIIDRVLREVDPKYVDHVPFPARTIVRAGRTYYPLPIKCTLEAKLAIVAAASEKGLSATALAQRILDRVLPKLPE